MPVKAMALVVGDGDGDVNGASGQSGQWAEMKRSPI